jgi:hypothetical protein
MSNVRRWYVYLVCAITINAVVWSVIGLLRNLLISGINAPETALALEIAVIIISLPIYIIHWIWARRTTAREPDELSSIPRRLYLYGMMAGFMAPLVFSGYGLIRSLLFLAFDESPKYLFYPQLDPGEQAFFFLIALIILALMWAYHWWLKKVDDRIEKESDVSVIFRQLYTYLFCATGLVMSTMALINLLCWLIGQLDPAGMAIGISGEGLLPSEIARIVVGVTVWVLFWRAAQNQFLGPDERDRKSVVRKVYLYLILFIAVITVVTTATFVIADLLGRALDVPGESGDVHLPISIFIAVGLVWAYHAYVLRKDTEIIEEAHQQALVRRIYLYLMAGVGLAALLSGLVGDISVLIRALTGKGFILELREQLMWFTSVLIAGLPLWIVYWRQVQMAVAQPGSAGLEERRSLVRRIYLYFFIFIATMAVLGSVIYIVSQLVELALGARDRVGLGTDIGQAVAYLLVSVLVWLYHGRLLRSDSRTIKEEEVKQVKPLNVVVVDNNDGSLAKAIVKELEKKLPSVNVTPLALSMQAAHAMDIEPEKQSHTEIITSAEVIVGPWTMECKGKKDGAEFYPAIDEISLSKTHKLLIPISETGLDWIGVESYKMETIVNEVLNAVKQIAVGDEVKKGRKLGPLGIAIIVLISLCILASIVPMVFQYFMF